MNESTASRVLVGWCTFPDEASAREAARTLVRERLVACAQTSTSPIQSIYRWKNAIQEEPEVLLTMKTTPARWPDLVRRLTQLHSYDVPEIVSCPARASRPYAAWVQEQCRPADAS